MLAGTIVNDERQRVGCTRLGEGNLVGIADLRDVDGVVNGVADNAIAANTDADAAELAGRNGILRCEKMPYFFLCVAACVRRPMHRV